MTLNKTHLIAAIVGLIVGLLVGFFVGKGIYDKPIETKIERDTVTVTDTIPQYYPKPVEVERVRTEYRYLTQVVNNTDTLTKTVHDSVLVEVPITSKHYGNNQYDAWISGYYPMLDSIKVYQKTEYITETITKTKPKSKWSIGVQAGYGYGFRSKLLEPYAGIGVGYNF